MARRRLIRLRSLRRASAVVVLLALPATATATVYRWRSEGGVTMLSNDPADVPEDRRESAEAFTAKPAPAVRAADPAGDPDVGGSGAYDRGYAAGLVAAEREIEIAERVARSVAASAQSPPAPIVIEQASAPPVESPMPYGASPYYASPYYPGGYSPGAYLPYAYVPYPFTSFGFSTPVVSRVFVGHHRHGFGGLPHAHGGFRRGGFGGLR